MRNIVLVLNREQYFIGFDSIEEAQQWGLETFGFKNWLCHSDLAESWNDKDEAIVGEEENVQQYIQYRETRDYMAEYMGEI